MALETPLDRYDRAVASGRSVLAGIKPDQLDAATPCVSWTVRELMNHFIGAQDFFSNAFGAQPSAPDGTDFSSGDYVAAFDKATSTLRAAAAEDGALEKTVSLPWGSMPGANVLGMACTDTFAHAWDLARATGQPTDLDAELAGDLLEGSKMNIQPAFRGPDGSGMPFGPEQQAPAGASAADELAAFLGRVV